MTDKKKSIEEKAKRYDEAIKRAKDALNDGTISSNTITYLQDIFSELKESEDEKIRKYIIKYFEASKNELSEGFKWNGITVEECIAWLEKQGEQKPNPCDGCINRKGCINCENGELRETMQEEPVSDELEKVVEEIVDPTVLNVYGVKEIANRLRRTMIDSASEDLEEEIDVYLATKKWREINETFSAERLISFARHFAQWQKQQMMKDTEEAEITSKPNDYGEYMPRVIVPVSCSYKKGEKVKVIIIKEG